MISGAYLLTNDVHCENVRTVSQRWLASNHLRIHKVPHTPQKTYVQNRVIKMECYCHFTQGQLITPYEFNNHLIVVYKFSIISIY